MATSPNPLQALAWPGATGTNNVGGAPMPQPFGSTSPLGPGGPGNVMPSNLDNPNQIARGIGEANLIGANQRNNLTPSFANAMFGTAGPAASFYQQLMNLGSPYYQQAQRQGWEQGVGQAANTSAQSRQQLASSGYGYGPSGLEAGMLGGQAVGSSGNLAMNFLQQLFQNQNMQLQGAGGLANIAQMFNPAQLTGQSTPIGNMQQTPTFMQNLTSLLNSLSGAGYKAGGANGASVSL